MRELPKMVRVPPVVGVVSRQDIKLLAESLAEGDTVRQDCPTCGRAKTFTITKKDGLAVWNCYSTHCAEKGAFGAHRTNVVRTTLTLPKPSAGPFIGELREIDEEQKAFLGSKIGFGGWHFYVSGVRYAPVEDRYAFPIYAPTGSRRGWVLRSYRPDRVRWKSITRLDREENHLSWYRGAQLSDKVLIVEDIPSAVRSAAHYPGWTVAICGGGVGPDYIREIREYARGVVWAMDPDATATAIRLHRTYGLVFETSMVLPLERDLKDMDEETLKEVLSHVS